MENKIADGLQTEIGTGVGGLLLSHKDTLSKVAM